MTTKTNPEKSLFESIGDKLGGASDILRDATADQLKYAQNMLGISTSLWLAESKEAQLTGNEKRAQRETVNSLKRKKNREARAEMLTADNQLIQNADLKKQAREIFKDGKTIDTISAGDLLKLEMTERGALSKIFAYKKSKDANGLPVETPLDVSKIEEGDEITVDFGGNISANAKIGAADILPPSVRVIKIIDQDLNVRIGVRQVINGRAGYYDVNGKYLPIYTGYTLRIPTASEAQSPEYKASGVTNVLETNPKELEKLTKEDAEAMKQFKEILEKSKAEDRVSEIYGMVAGEAGNSGTYSERLTRMLDIANKYRTQEGQTEEMKTLLGELTARLTRTKELIGNKNFNLDFERYKQAIAKHESGGQGYLARNDEAGKKRGVRPGAWAFGKYQFTVETLSSYGVQLGNPPEESKIQAFLNNPTLQEEVMDRYIVGNLEKHILGNPKIQEDMARDGTSLSYYLALTHIGGPGALSGDKLRKDWLGTSTHTYAMGVSNVYERSLGGPTPTLEAVARKEAIPGAKIDRETLIANASRHLGKPYKMGGNGDRTIDCSQLIVESLKDAGVVHSRYDNNAQGFKSLSTPKSASNVERGDLVFLRKGGQITHVAIALGPVKNGSIDILDASTNTGTVAERKQRITGEVEIGAPVFYT